jgi:hypothetical protein
MSAESMLPAIELLEDLAQSCSTAINAMDDLSPVDEKPQRVASMKRTIDFQGHCLRMAAFILKAHANEEVRKQPLGESLMQLLTVLGFTPTEAEIVVMLAQRREMSVCAMIRCAVRHYQVKVEGITQLGPMTREDDGK